LLAASSPNLSSSLCLNDLSLTGGSSSNKGDFPLSQGTLVGPVVTLGGIANPPAKASEGMDELGGISSSLEQLNHQQQ
ncbi:hypothetical protein Tco_0554958, partial [Tanacetum coccineum]